MEVTSPVSKARGTSALILVGVQPGAAAGKSRSGPPGKKELFTSAARGPNKQLRSGICSLTPLPSCWNSVKSSRA